MRSECFNIQAFKLSATKRCSAVGGSSLLFTLLRATFLHSSPLFHRFTHLYIYFSSIRSLSASPPLVYLLRSNNFRLGDFFDIKTLEIKRSSLKVLSRRPAGLQVFAESCFVKSRVGMFRMFDRALTS